MVAGAGGMRGETGVVGMLWGSVCAAIASVSCVLTVFPLARRRALLEDGKRGKQPGRDTHDRGAKSTADPGAQPEPFTPSKPHHYPY